MRNDYEAHLRARIKELRTALIFMSVLWYFTAWGWFIWEQVR